MKKIAGVRKCEFYENTIPSPNNPIPSFKKICMRVCITLEVMHHKQRHMLSIVFTSFSAFISA